MRIIGTIPHPFMKISIFQLNMKFAVKFEAGLMEQTFKIRQSDAINTVEDIHRMVDEVFMEACLEQFKTMNTDLGECLKRFTSDL